MKKRRINPGMGLMRGNKSDLIAQELEKEYPELVWLKKRPDIKLYAYDKLTAVFDRSSQGIEIQNQRQKKLIEKQRDQFKKTTGELKNYVR